MKPSLDWLLICLPAAVVMRYIPSLRNDVALFAVSGLAIIPLAGWMGKATDHLAARFGPGMGGLLNATFGNAAELIIAMVALSRGLTGIVKASITGSILGNTLLVLGVSVLVGGWRRPQQRFNATAIRVSATTLLLATVALIVPTVFHVAAQNRSTGWTPEAEQHLSLAIGVVLIVAYAALLLFSLKTHAQLFGAKSEGTSESWSRTKSLVVLGIATALAALMSEFLVGTVEAAREQLGLTEVFVGVVIVATIGNAAEHSTAVLAAVRDKMDLALGIAIGSSIQVALFIAPVLMFASYLFGAPMDFEFTLPEIVAVAAAVLVVVQICGDGESNWLEGALLLAVYAVLAVLFFFLPAR
ncbi:MAG TPA: calcium/proton exchanger [Verrucomicrobiae bacterium]|nr:calcium/proton exchanger [Verrucomicrobiae bacterium]